MLAAIDTPDLGCVALLWSGLVWYASPGCHRPGTCLWQGCWTWSKTHSRTLPSAGGHGSLMPRLGT